MPVLRATDLPTSLEDLELSMNLVNIEEIFWTEPPDFVAFGSHQNLQRITLASYESSGNLGGYDRQRGLWRPALLPRSLEVRAS